VSGKLLVVRLGAIGDALLACPALAALRAARPGDSLLLMAHPAVRELVLRHGLADRFISRDGPQADALFAPAPGLARDRIGPVDAAVAWTGDADGVVRRNLAGLGAKRVVVAPSRPPEGTPKHAAQHLLDTLAPLGLGGCAAEWPGFRARARAMPQHSGSDGDGPLVVLHLGSGSPRKNWPAERFARLAGALWQRRRARLIVLVGPADELAFETFAREVAAPFTSLPGRPLHELSALLSACDLYVGNDSGLSHLAGMSGAPTLVLFGPTDPRVWRPLGSHVAVLSRASLTALPAEAALEAAESLLAARRAAVLRSAGD
jgi:ADP-heptose:LPS heptosyltransferase